MITSAELPGIGRASDCQVTPAAAHVPKPVRFVWHHIQPKEAGGQTETANLVQLCDSCHYTVHRLLWALRCLCEGHADDEQRELLARPPSREQMLLALRGYGACVIAGTTEKIPNEG